MIVQHRRGTTQEWQELDLIPREGELVIEECSNIFKCKIGDGKNPFSKLPYLDLDDKTRDLIFKNISVLEANLASSVNIINKALKAEAKARTDGDIVINNKIGLISRGKTIVELISDVKAAVTAEQKTRENADNDLSTRIDRIDAFFAGAAKDKNIDGELQNALDTLVEIQNYITADGESTKNILDTINAITASTATNANKIEEIESNYIRLGTDDGLYVGKAGVDEIIFDCGNATINNANGGAD